MSWTARQAAVWLSEDRIRTFLEQTSGDYAQAESLYLWHADLASACHAHVHHFEVLLRNAIDAALMAGTHSDDWLHDPKVLTPRGLDEVRAAERRLARRVDGNPRTHGDLVAALQFGFWRAMFEAPYENLWRSTVRFAFPHSGTRFDRKYIGNRLEAIRKLRNRVAHHDSLMSVNVAARLREMESVTNGIDPDATRWISMHSQVHRILSERPR